MDDKSHKDRLDQFFDQTWDDRNLSREMGAPDLEDAWGNIQDGLRSGRRMPWWIFLFIIPLLTGGAFLVFMYSGMGSSQESEAVPMNMAGSNEAKPIKPSFAISSSEVADNENEKTSADPLERDPLSDEQVVEPVYRNTNQKDLTSNLSDVTTQLVNAGEEKPQAVAGDEGLSRIEGSTRQQNTGLEKDVSKSPRNLANSTIPLIFAALESGISQLEQLGDLPIDLYPPDLNLPMNEVVRGSKKWNLELSGGFGRHVFMDGNEAQIDQVAIRFEDGHYRMAGLKASFEYRSDRKIDLGMGWRDHAFTSHYELGVNYTSTGEIQDGQGFWHQGYNHTLPTVFGDTPMEHVLIRGENDGLNEGEFIPFALFLEHQVKELNLSVGHSWDFPVRAWQISLGADVMGSYWYDKEQISNLNLVSRHDKVHHNRTEYASSTPDLVRPWYLALGASVGIERNIIPNHKAGVRGRLQHSVITPILFHDIEYDAQFVDISLYWKVSL